MTYDLIKIQKSVKNCVDTFMKEENDIFLLEKDVGERAISHRLGLYLQSEFREMNVDCEYNRKGSKIDPKRFDPKKIKSRPVYPDIIVHRRGDDSNNILAVEVKKQGKQGIEYDEIKLKHFTSNGHKYRFGLLLIFYTKKNSKNRPILRWFSNGMEMKHKFT